MNPISISIISVSLMAVTGFLYLTLKFRVENARLLRDLELLRNDFNALCAGAVGVDKRVLRLEQRGRDLQHRQETFEQRQSTSQRPYAEAIHQVQKGADALRLVDEFGLSRSEADLIVMLHGAREAG